MKVILIYVEYLSFNWELRINFLIILISLYTRPQHNENLFAENPTVRWQKWKLNNMKSSRWAVFSSFAWFSHMLVFYRFFYILITLQATFHIDQLVSRSKSRFYSIFKFTRVFKEEKPSTLEGCNQNKAGRKK